MFALACGITAAAMHVVAFLIYNRQMLRGDSSPNTSTWTLWAILTTLNCASYQIAWSNLVISLLPLASSVMCIATFGIALLKGKFKRMDLFDTTALLLGIAIAIVWWANHDSVLANRLLQIPIAISFIPTYRGILQDPEREKRVWPWLLWTTAYIVSIFTIMLEWQIDPQLSDSAWQLLYPMNCLVLHGGIWFIVHLKHISKKTAI